MTSCFLGPYGVGRGERGARVGHFTPSWGPYSPYIPHVFREVLFDFALQIFFLVVAPKQNLFSLSLSTFFAIHFHLLYILHFKFWFPSRHSFCLFLVFALQSRTDWYNIHPWWRADKPAAAALVFSCCSRSFLLLDFPGRNQGSCAGPDSNPRLPYWPLSYAASLTELHRTLLWAAPLPNDEQRRTLHWATPHPTTELRRTLY